MFSEHDNEVVGFNSSWQTEKTTEECSSQTTEFSTKENATSTSASQSIAVQTDIPEHPPWVNAPPPPGLAEWLRNIAPMVMKELKIIETCSIFKGYDPYANDEEEPKAKLLQKLEPVISEKPSQKAQDDSLHSFENTQETVKQGVSSVSWSCAGSTLAVAHGHLYHEDWCQHHSHINVYLRSGQLQELKLTAELKLSSCASTVAFHPTEPALLASGTVAGEVSIWNMQHGSGSSPLLVTQPSCHLSRRVSSLLWLTESQTKVYNVPSASNQVLVTAGSDGSIVIWLVNATAATLTQHICYEPYGSQLSLSMFPPDISCMDFLRSWPHRESNAPNEGSAAEDMFVVGCRTGEVILCRASTSKSIAGCSSMDPFVSNLEPHGASVLQVSFTSRPPGTMLLTLGADMEIRTYNVPQEYPMRVVHLDVGLTCAQWLPDSSTLLLGASGHSRPEQPATLQVWDVSIGKEVAIDGMIESEDSTSGLTSLAFNTKNCNLVACGDIRGNVKIWNIPFHTIASTPHPIS